MGKKQYVLITKRIQKGCPKVYQGYTNKGQPKRELTAQENPPSQKNQLYPIQVKNSSKDLSLTPQYTLDQDQRLQMKDLFSLCAEKTSLSKVTLYLSRQTVQKRQRGAAFHTFLRFFPTRAPCQDKKCLSNRKRRYPLNTNNGQNNLPKQTS